MSSSLPLLVNIGTHSLALYTHGPEPRSSKDPVVLFVSGVASSSLNWAAVVRLLSSMRSYTYDRSGYHNSDPSPLEPTAENIAVELLLLIKKAPIFNPLIVVGHSWAGVIIHELLALTLTENTPKIAGLVLVDANHESLPQVMDVNHPDLLAISQGVDFYSGIGVELEHKLTQEEWDALISDESTEKYNFIAAKEESAYIPSFETLQKKHLNKKQPLMGSNPVYIIGGMRSRDWKGLYKAGVEKGNGTEEQRSKVQDMIRTADEKTEILMKEFMKLSTKSKFVFARESGHFVQFTEPHIVADGVTWVLDNYKSDGPP